MRVSILSLAVWVALSAAPVQAGTVQGADNDTGLGVPALLLVGGAILMILDANRNRNR